MGMMDWKHGALVFYYLCWLSLPVWGLMLVATHLDRNIRIPWSRLIQGAVLLVGLTFTGYSQQRPIWAQEQREEIQRLREDVERIEDDARDNTKELGYLEQTVVNHRIAHVDDHSDHETRLRKVEANVVWVLAGCGVLAFLTPGIFHLIIHRRNGRNGTGGTHK